MSGAVPTNAGAPPPRGSRRRWLLGILAGGVIVLLLAGGFAVWYVFLRPAGPPPVGPGAPVIPPDAVTSATAVLGGMLMVQRPLHGSRWAGLLAAVTLCLSLSAPTLAQSPSAPTTPSAATTQPLPSAPAAPDGSLDGTWTIDPTIGSFDYAAGDFTGSWVGYRAQEELVGIGGQEAIGRTPDVSGSITLAGSAVTSADLSADLTTLRSDERMRDGQLGRQGVQTDRFPTATFSLTEPIELGVLPAEGEAIRVNAVGDLTIHGVTRSVTIPLAAVRSGDVIGVSGSLTFGWGDFDMDRPSSMRVVSLADQVTMELQIFLRHDAAAP